MKYDTIPTDNANYIARAINIYKNNKSDNKGKRRFWDVIKNDAPAVAPTGAAI